MHKSPKSSNCNICETFEKTHPQTRHLSPCNLIYLLKQYDTCLHLPSCYTNKHINNLHTNRHNKTIHTLANTLMIHLTARCLTLINLGSNKNKTPYYSIPSWPLPHCKCRAQLHVDMLCILGTTPIGQPPF